MADDTILETRGLTKEFKGFVAVKDVSLSVRRGSIHALIGPNGAGKTTCFTKWSCPGCGNGSSKMWKSSSVRRYLSPL